MVVKPTREVHHDVLMNRISFAEAYRMVSSNPVKEYRTSGNQSPFVAVASKAGRGNHMGEKVIIFKTEGKEMARCYPCCWGHMTNCNRTYIDCYTSVL